MFKFPYQDQYLKELKQAELAERNGNKGKARVCARRAAGILAGEYLRRRGLGVPATSAYDRLKFLILLPDLPNDVQTITSHFLLKTNPDRSFPDDVNLIADTYWLEKTLLEVDI